MLSLSCYRKELQNIGIARIFSGECTFFLKKFDNFFDVALNTQAKGLFHQS